MRADHRGKDRDRPKTFAPDEIDYYECRKAEGLLPFSEKYPRAFRAIIVVAFVIVFLGALALLRYCSGT